MLARKGMRKIRNGSFQGDKILRLIVLLFIIVEPILSLAKPDEVEEQAVQHCQYLRNVEGSSGYGKNFNWMPLAKHSVLTKAEKIGASHVVWEKFSPIGAFNGIAEAKVYNCSS